MTTFRLFAGTNIGLRDNNEDNFTVCRDLTLNDWIVPASQQETIQLGERGCLAVVADGMGGQNAGEVASATAIETVQKLFAPDVMPANTVEKPERIISYLKKVIVQADLRIKQRSANDPSVEGMGSTIVIVWFIGSDAYVGWMGDSRAYSYIPNKGITRITKDHSYVQQLVDAKLLSEEQAMNDPNSNIIMRSLGDVSQKAKPDVICHPVIEGEIIMLCTDGLCGICKDSEIEDILKNESNDIFVCKEKLVESALAADGSDNITIALLQVVSVDSDADTNECPRNILAYVFGKYISIKHLLIGIFVCILVLISFLAGFYKSQKKFDNENIVVKSDSSFVSQKDTMNKIEDSDTCIGDSKIESAVNNMKKKNNIAKEDPILERVVPDPSEPTISEADKSTTTESQ